MAASLAAKQIHCTRGASTILDSISLSISPGDRVAVVGPNGVGKSTLLSILAGETEPDAGSVETDAETTIQYVPQETVAAAGTTLRQHFMERSGVAAATARLEETAAALGEHPEQAATYETALANFMALGGDQIEARIARACSKLGLSGRLDLPMHAVSGGEASRQRLAQTLIGRCDFLLLDEPTNDLDFDGLALLEAHVESFQGGVVFVSHDRTFLRQHATRVLSFEAETRHTSEFHGSFDEFEAQSARVQDRERRTYESWARKRSHFTSLLSERGTEARSAGKQADRRGTKAAASKVRSARRQIELLDRGKAEKPWRPTELRFELEGVVPSKRALTLSGAVAQQGGFRLGPIDLLIGGRDRVSLEGRNGAGKSTLLRVMLGDLEPAAGSRQVGPGVRIGTLDQGRTLCATGDPLITTFCDAAAIEEVTARTLLGNFGLVGSMASRPANSLSSGERTRVSMALLQAISPSLLVLDEPTNHLDFAGIGQLEQALDAYPGAVLLVSHDRHLLERFQPTLRPAMTDGQLTTIT